MTTTEQRQIVLARPRPVTLAAVAIGVIPFALHAWMALNGFFGHDDFVILHRAAAHGPFDPGYLFQDYSGHLAPGMFLLAWFVTAVAPLSHVFAVLPLLAMQAGASVLFWRLLVRCFGSRWTLLLPFAVYAFSPLILYPTLWWAYGVQLFPLLLTMFGALNAHLTYLRTRESKQIVLTLLWTVAGMAFYEKAALFIAVLFGFTLLLGERMPRRVWVAHGVVLAAFTALFVGLTASRVKNDLPSADAIADFVGYAVVNTFLPGLFGGPWTGPAPGSTIATSPLWLRLAVAALAVVVLVGGLVKAPRRAGAAWLMLVGYLAVDLGLVIVTRLPEIGPLIGNDPRYTADAVPIAVLCAAFAYLRPGERDGGPKRPLVLGLVALLGISSTFSFLWLAPGLRFAESERYVGTARAALAANPSMTFYDTTVPDAIMSLWLVEDGKASRVVGLLPQRPRFDQPAEEMFLLDDNGSPHRITGVKDPVVGRKGPVADCGYPVGGQVVTIPLSSRVEGRRLLRMEYYTSSAGPVRLALGPAAQEVNFAEGLHVLYVVVNGGSDRLEVSRGTDVDPMCVVDVRIGSPTT
ncbi:hypothetical protein ACFFQW_14880 [Umezawaea endophytica]|uniref:Uncharacterized protein n=1 Tax=Umezawaea endophytica TaxID=1654476 RepID=A0A9X2VKI6_9PSEU|nr:hypothetical protein [Umezawaea endophytica]MCS7477789.1 hypothetical protein [Umezawaea endophytica]